MINSVDSIGNKPSFKSILRVDAEIKNPAKLERIAKEFSKRTANMRDCLSISSRIEEYDNKECFYLGKKYENSTAAFFEDSFDTMMEKLSENDLVTKLVKIARSIKAINKSDTHFEAHHQERYRLNALRNKNLKIAKSCREKNDEIMAKRFEILAGMNAKKLARMDAEQKRANETALQTIEKVAEGDADILSMKSLVI